VARLAYSWREPFRRRRAAGVSGFRHAGSVQTFLPYPNFENALAVLDTPRLGKQRVETLQILRALVLPEYGWRNHPAVRMWQGRLPALVLYGLTSVAQWERRGFGDSTAAQIAEFAPEVVDLTQADLAAAGELPSWLGDDRLHRSHQSKLLSKDLSTTESTFQTSRRAWTTTGPGRTWFLQSTTGQLGIPCGWFSRPHRGLSANFLMKE